MESKQDKNKTQTLRNHNDDTTINVNYISNVTESSQSSNIDIKQEISECHQNPKIQERTNLDIKKVAF